MIVQFQDDYRWLSNFTPLETPIMLHGNVYPTVEHYYVAMKTDDLELRKDIANCDTPGKAKSLGQSIELVANWSKRKGQVMLYATTFKYAPCNPILRQKLIDTEQIHIQEGNWWNDTYWGVCLKTNKGKNVLGNIIMSVRNNIQLEDSVGWPS